MNCDSNAFGHAACPVCGMPESRERRASFARFASAAQRRLDAPPLRVQIVTAVEPSLNAPLVRSRPRPRIPFRHRSTAAKLKTKCTRRTVVARSIQPVRSAKGVAPPVPALPTERRGFGRCPTGGPVAKNVSLPLVANRVGFLRVPGSSTGRSLVRCQDENASKRGTRTVREIGPPEVTIGKMERMGGHAFGDLVEYFQLGDRSTAFHPGPHRYRRRDDVLPPRLTPS